MSTFFDEFQRVSKDDWKQKMIADLKGKDPELLRVNDPIEEIRLDAYHHPDDSQNQSPPGAFPYTRGIGTRSNEWVNLKRVYVKDEKTANESSLKALMSGATGLHFVLEKPTVNGSILFDSIGFEHIHTQFTVANARQITEIKSEISVGADRIQFHLDPIAAGSFDVLDEIIPDLKQEQYRVVSINGAAVHNCGANTWQEIAYCLSAGHDVLHHLIHSGFTADEAAACLSFRMGVGGNYLFETAKIRAMRTLWSGIIRAYKPEHNCTYNCSMTAVIGHMNKSLRDPYTNLLRQTTETLSALAAGVDFIEVLPYDLYDQNGPGELAERMAINIPLILQEESYFAKIVDPLGGSYSVEKLTELISEKAWNHFQELEKDGGMIRSGLSRLRTDIASTVEKRKQRIQSGEQVLIGINAFENPDSQTGSWKKIPGYLGMNSLCFESLTENISA